MGHNPMPNSAREKNATNSKFVGHWLHPTITFISFLLFLVSETGKDPKTSSEALGLA
jgi:hypothetical protein